jgi:pimeloyl-ACP methyl ester carboxylesterase
MTSAYKSVDPDLRRHLAQLPLLAMTRLVPRGETVRALPPDGHHPLVLVYGFGGRPGNFLALRTWLRFAGRRRVYLADFGNSESLEHAALQLGSMILTIAERNELGPDERVDVVAHSMGGLVARLALEDDAVSSRVATVLTLGTPHSGTWMARFGGTSAIPLRPDSPLIARLAAQLPWPADPGKPRLVAMWSQTDMLVVPPEGAQVAGALNVEMPGFTHYSYLLDPAAWRRIQAVLDESEHPGNS